MMSQIDIKRGDTWVAVFEYRDPEDGVVDLTSCDAFIQVRRRRTRELLLTITTGDGIVIDGPAGEITLNVSADETAKLPIGTHDYDVRVTWPDGVVRTSPTFLLRILEDVSRDTA